MFSSVSRVGVVAPFVSATAQNVASQLRPAVVAAPSIVHKFTLPDKEDRLTNAKLDALLPKSHGARATCGIQGNVYFRVVQCSPNDLTMQIFLFVLI